MSTALTEATAPMITVQTLIKGPVEVAETDLISFATPLLGFEKLKRFLIFQTHAGAVYWMQAVEDAKVAFCLLAPFSAGLDPDMELAGTDVADIGAKDASEIDVYTLIVLDKDPNQRRTNLRAPILVCRHSGLAKQVVLNNPNLPIRFMLRDLGAKA